MDHAFKKAFRSASLVLFNTVKGILKAFSKPIRNSPLFSEREDTFEKKIVLAFLSSTNCYV